MNLSNPRREAADALIKWEASGIFIDDAVDLMLSRSALSVLDKSLAATLVYGVVERKLTLDYMISALSKRSADALDRETKALLRLGLYQLMYTDKIPEYAAVNETVSCAPARSRGLVNAVLREAVRRGCKPFYPDPDICGDAEYYSIRYSLSEFIVSEWIKDYGKDTATALFEDTFRRRPMTLRVNTVRTTQAALSERLAGAGIESKPNAAAPDMLDVPSGHVTEFAGYDEGLFFVEDAASRICAASLGTRAGDTVVDVCAAPGGKSFSLAFDMENRGEIHAFDISKSKIRQIAAGASRMGLDIIKAEQRDGKAPDEKLSRRADRVLCDVPCSGLGVISKKPDIRYRDEKSAEKLPGMGYDILSASAGYLKDGGRLVYSTCTLRRAENEDVTDKFLSEHKEFSPAPFCVFGIDASDGKVTLMPHKNGTDGFYIAAFTKNRRT
ncbi:MAG: 16S rRNA (cytosine(967)-C(5))-methyltransferase RsmB [Firmicutes bacterium]|nr:16S rRNA (cytosine(967)-C(5))-methyltransferase RsmB [Bacillota bacterium]